MIRNQKTKLFILQNDLMGGAEQLLKMLCYFVSENEAHVDVIIMRKPMKRNWDEHPQNVRIHYLNADTYYFGIFKLAWFLFGFCRKFEISECYASNININGLIGWMRSLGAFKCDKLVIRETTSVFLRVHGLKRYFHTLKYLMGYKHADLIICQTDLMKNQFLDFLKPSQKWNLKTIPNPVDLKKISILSRETPKPNLFKKTNKYIVSAGRLIPEKGFDLLISAFEKFNLEYPEYHLIILGEGPHYKFLKDLIQELKLENSVFLPGHVLNPVPFFKESNICIVSSRIEGFPNVLLQMMCCNQKVVSTLCAGHIDNIPGIIKCQAGSQEAIFDALMKAVNSDFDEEVLGLKEEFLKKNNISEYYKYIKGFIQ